MLFHGKKRHVSDIEHGDALNLLSHLFHYPDGAFRRAGYRNELIDRMEREGYLKKEDAGEKDRWNETVFKYELTDKGRVEFVGKVEERLKIVVGSVMMELLGAKECYDEY